MIPAGEVDLTAVQEATARQAARATAGTDDIEAYRTGQAVDPAYREATGPLHAASGPSGVVVHHDRVLARWGDTGSVESCFELTRALLTTVAGLAFEREVLTDVHAPVARSVDHPAFAGPAGQQVSWEHLLQQSSGWDGELWGHRTAGGTPPGAARADDDVRVDLLALALTLVWRRGLDDVARTELLHPMGATATWSWPGYRDATVAVDGRDVPVAGGGALWGGGLQASADDLARIGRLYLHGGRWHGRRLLGREWVEACWTPSGADPDHGYLWGLNDRGRVFPSGPRTGRAAVGDLGRHLLWVDPARDLVVVSHWGDGVDALLWELSAAVPAR